MESDGLVFFFLFLFGQGERRRTVVSYTVTFEPELLDSKEEADVCRSELNDDITLSSSLCAVLDSASMRGLL